MFEKEAEEFTTESGFGSDCNNLTSYDANSCVEVAFQKGAEFGYNKANEWHYMKDGDLPKGEGDLFCCMAE